MDKLTGVIDSPVDITNTMQEILAWQETVLAMPLSAQRAIALEQVAALMLVKAAEQI